MVRRATPRATAPVTLAGVNARAPAVIVTVLGQRPVFACGRWFQPGSLAACPAGYFSARQWQDLDAHPDLSISPRPAP